MDTKRRKCKLANTENRNVNLKAYEQLIIDTVNNTVPNKHPKVFEDYFSTDMLTQSEAVALGRALSKIEALNVYGKTLTIFRLFDGKTYDSEEAQKPTKNKPTGGRKR
jgi:hypothetical protein